MKKHLILMTVAATLLTSCGGSKTTTAEADKFDYTVEQFAETEGTDLLPDRGCSGRKGYSV